MGEKLIMGLLSGSLTGLFNVLLLAVLCSVWKKRLSAGYHKYLWILTAACMLSHFTGWHVKYTAVITIPDYVIRTKWGEVYLIDIVTALWLTISSVLVIYYVAGYLKMRCRLKRWSRESHNPLTEKIIAGTGLELGMKRLPVVRIVEDQSSSPFTIGFRKCTVFLPDREFPEEDLRHILKHEMIHCQKKDVLLGMLFTAAACIYWFHPFVWLMRALLLQDMELICDRLATQNLPSEKRKEYCDVIMSCVEADSHRFCVGSTGYIQNTAFLKKRFAAILGNNAESNLCRERIFFIAAGILILLISSSFSFTVGERRLLYGKTPITYGIEVQADIDGNGKKERVYVTDNISGDNAFTQLSAQLENGETVFKDYPDHWSSYLVAGDLTEDGISDIVLMRIATGSTYGGGEFSVLHMGENGWEEYPDTFLSNPALNMEQPENFGQLSCIGASMINADGRCLLRIISLTDMMNDTVQCIDCSYQEEGWFIEQIRSVTQYFEMDKESELLGILL